MKIGNKSNEINRSLNISNQEKFKHQNSKVIWLTGLSGAGKTTLSINIEKELNRRGFITQLLDGDIVRKGNNNKLGFSVEDRFENIRRIANQSRQYLDNGIICINSFISPTDEIRMMAKNIIGPADFIEIFINAPIEICEQRDVKGLYKKARAGLIKDFTGIDAPYEIPMNPDLEVRTDKLNIDDSVQICLELILPKIAYQTEG